MKNLAILALLCFVATAADAFAGTSTETPQKTFSFRLTGEPETLDWNRAHTPIETYLLLNLMEGLVRYDENFKIAPALAEGYQVSKDGKTYTFKLRKNSKWSDGEPLTSKDFIFSWKRLLTPETTASYAYLLFDIDGAQEFYQKKISDFSKVGVSAPDAHTLVVRLAKPIAHWIHIPTFWVTFPMREDVVTKYGKEWEKPGKMVSAGPFVLFSRTTDQNIVLRRNPYYQPPEGSLGEAAAKSSSISSPSNVDEVVARIIKDESTAMSLYEAGRLDLLTDLSATDLKRLQGNSELQTFSYLKVVYLGLVVNQGLAKNVHVRRAIAQAIDKTKFALILNGGQVPASSFIPAPMMGYQAKAGLGFSPEKAREELKKANLKEPLKLSLLCGSAEKTLTVVQFLQSELKKNLGLEVQIESFENKTFRAQADLKTRPMFLLSWSADFPDPDNFYSLFLSDSGNNRMAYQSKSVDDLIFKARASTKASERLKIYEKIENQLTREDMVVVPLYYEPNQVLVKSRVKGLTLNPLNYLYLNRIQIK